MEYLAHFVKHDVSAVSGRDSVDAAKGGGGEAELKADYAVVKSDVEASVARNADKVSHLLVTKGQGVAWLNADDDKILLNIHFYLEEDPAVDVGEKCLEEEGDVLCTAEHGVARINVTVNVGDAAKSLVNELLDGRGEAVRRQNLSARVYWHGVGNFIC